MKEKLLELIETYAEANKDFATHAQMLRGFEVCKQIQMILDAQQAIIDAARPLRSPFAPGTGIAERARLVEAFAQLDALAKEGADT